MRRILPFLLTLIELAAAIGAGAAGHLYFGLAIGEAVSVGLAVLLVLLVGQLAFQRRRDRALFDRRIADLAHLESTFTRNTQNLVRRLSVVEARLEKINAPEAPAMDGELRGLAATVRQLSGDLSQLESRVAAAEAAPAGAAAVPARAEDMPAEDDAAAVLAAIQEAIASKTVELLLQPIVTLPQRRVHAYELFARLRDRDGRDVPPRAFLPVAEAEGLIARLDQLVLFRAIQLLRRMSAEEKPLLLFCNLSTKSLADGDFAAEFIEFAQANRALADTLVFEFRQSGMMTLPPAGREALAALAEMGFRLSIDQVTDFTVDFRDQAARGFRFAKVSAGTLLHGAPTGGIELSELSEFLARAGIDLIAHQVETERQIMDLIDLDIRYGQGDLFTPPRPLKSDRPSAATMPAQAEAG